MEEINWQLHIPRVTPQDGAAVLARAEGRLSSSGLELARGLLDLLDLAWCRYPIPSDVLERVTAIFERYPGEYPSFTYSTISYSVADVSSFILLLDETAGPEMLERVYRASPSDSIRFQGLVEHPRTSFGVRKEIFLRHSGRFLPIREYMSLRDDVRADGEMMSVLRGSRNPAVVSALQRPGLRNPPRPEAVRRHLRSYLYTGGGLPYPGSSAANVRWWTDGPSRAEEARAAAQADPRRDYPRVVPGLPRWAREASDISDGRFSLVAWQAPASPGALLPGTEKILGAVDADGRIDARSWAQRFRYGGSEEVFKQLWTLAQGWPTSPRMRLFGSGMQHREVRLAPAVAAGAAADLVAGMVRTPSRASRDHIRYFAHGCLETQLRHFHKTCDAVADVYLAAWERVSNETFDDPQELLLWQVIARTIQRAPAYWPDGTRPAMMASIAAVVFDGGDLPPVLNAALLCVTAWNLSDGIPLASRVIQPLSHRFLADTEHRLAWRLTLEQAMEEGSWPPGMPRLSEQQQWAAFEECRRVNALIDVDDELAAEVESA